MLAELLAFTFGITPRRAINKTIEMQGSEKRWRWKVSYLFFKLITSVNFE